jgi:signal transduction histidine kinase
MVLLCGRSHSHEDEVAADAQEGGNPPLVRRVVKQVQDYCFSSPRFKGKRRDGNAYRALLLMNLIEAAFICINGILVYEMSTKDLQERFTHTVVFPLYLPRAMGMAIATNHQGSVALGNFVGLYFSRVYMGIRAPESLGRGRLFAVLLFALIGTCELQIGAWFIKKLLCPGNNQRKKVPTFDNVGQAFWYIIIVFSISLVFETLIAVAECCTRMVEWTYFFRYWATWWLGVLAAMLTVSPAVIHLMALGPLHLTFTRPTMKSSIKLVALWSITLGFLTLVFLFSVRTFIRPLPYLLFPLIISAAFQFNRVGWSLIVAVSSLFCALGTIHRDSSLYYMAGAPKSRASPSLVIQIELFTSVMGLVGIVLAAAVKEKNQLTRDLNRTNEDLEKTVKERTKELVKANEELQVSQKSAEHANHAKSEFLANMSHEIRTPIHGILGLTTLLLESKLTSDQKESLISLKECADLLLHIINSVLDLTKIEAGRLEIEKVPFSIRRLVSSTLRMLLTRAQDRGLQLLWEVEGGVPDLLIGDAGKLQQCLLNLVGNALKFTNQGKVTVRVALPKSKEPATDARMVSFRTSLVLEEDSVRLPLLSSQPVKQPTTFAKLRSWSSWPGAYFKVEPDKEIPAEVYDNVEELGLSKIAPVTEIEEHEEISSELPHSQLVQIEFEVKDTGIGITKDKLEDMFNPFTQGDPSTSRLYGGTGLGLCIVQRYNLGPVMGGVFHMIVYGLLSCN